MKLSHPRRRRPGAVRLDRLVKDCLGPAVARQGFGTAEILIAWSEIVGPELARRSRPERVKWPRRSKDDSARATVVIRAEGGDALELQHMQGEIIARLNTFLGWGAVARLVVRQAPVSLTDTNIPPVIPDSRRQLPTGSRNEPATPLHDITDPELREAFARLAAARAAEEDKSP